MLSMKNFDQILVTKEKHPAINLRVYLQTANHLAQADTVNIISWPQRALWSAIGNTFVTATECLFSIYLQRIPKEKARGF